MQADPLITEGLGRSEPASNGAVALGLGEETGSIEPGKVTDLIVLAHSQRR